MRRRNFLAASLSSVLPASVSAWTVSANSTIARPEGGVAPRDLIVVYNSADSAEAAAAQELQAFLERITKVQPRMVTGMPGGSAGPATTQFLVGRHQVVQELLSSGRLADPAKKDPEAYVVQSVTLGEKPGMVFLGGTGIATLYAVYHFLEKACGCGFYWDGDHVPHRDSVPAQGINIAAQPWFHERMCMNLTLYWYSSPWWEWDDWKTYIDWALKARLNILSLWDTPGEDVAWKKAWKRMGVEVSDNSYSGPPYEIFAPIKYGVRPPLTEGWREGQSALNKQITQYARQRGMRSLAPAVPGIVPPEYASARPEARMFEISWAGLPKQKYLHPLSPEYHQVGRAFLEEYISLYGNDHLYWLENYLECDVEGPAEVQSDVRREIAGANFKVLNEVDPQGIGIYSAWSFLFKPQFWTPQLIRESLERMPEDRVRVLDQWAEMVPEAKRTDYFFGRPWHFGVVYSFGGNTNMHGNLAFIEKQFHQVVDDPRAKQCVGFYPNEETIRHNYFYYDFLCRLGWNPKEVDLRSHVPDYALGRYGAASAPIMVEALKKLLASVYGTDDLSQPLYWHRLGREAVYFRLQIADRKSFIPSLRKALEIALAAAPAQSDNALYLRDLNDIGRQYLAELFNAHVFKIQECEAALDEAAFEREAGLLESLMQAIETLLSHDDYYWLSPLIRKAQRLPGTPSDVDVRVRDIYTLWADVIRDYASRDFYELVQGYYHPRVTTYVRALREALNMDQRMVYNPTELDREYDAIEKKWVKDGFPLVEQKPAPKQVIDTVKAILAKFASAEKV
ncbi:MAG TPA: alpha-N-acetylglucosaminidase TIM-barrel domain-containing protein [Terriglobia bacterium]|nr:alpha-N-acetylglucosaminidase TIM-barrel domain-containing protein [Terriglobia bacterium]